MGAPSNVRPSSLIVLVTGSIACLIAMGVACTLNPQPLPPDNPDGSTLGTDGSVFGAGEVADAAATPTSGGGADGGSDNVSGDADASDGSTDGADASADAGDSGDATSD